MISYVDSDEFLWIGVGKSCCGFNGNSYFPILFAMQIFQTLSVVELFLRFASFYKSLDTRTYITDTVRGIRGESYTRETSVSSP